MTEDFDGAQSQPLRPQTIDVDSRLIRDACRAHNERVMAEIDKQLLMEAREATDERVLGISASDLAAWRADMRARPPEPPQKKPHTRVDGAWTTPTEWNRP